MALKGSQRPRSSGSNAKVRKVEDVWPHLAGGAVSPIIDDPVSNATRMDNTERLQVEQARKDARPSKIVRDDSPGGAGTFEPAGGNSKFR